MRCIICNEILSDEELNYKSKDGKYLDTCALCIAPDSYVLPSSCKEYQFEALTSNKKRFFKTPE